MTGEKISNIKSMCLVEYANYLHHKRNIEKAIKYYNQAISLNSYNYYAYGGLAAALLAEKQFKQALEYCKKAYSIKSNLWGNITLFVIYNSLGEAISANEMLRKIFKYFNNNVAAAYDRLSYTYFQFGMHKEAEYYCKEAVKILPIEAGIHYNLANIYLAQEKFQAARDEFQNVLELTNDKRYKKKAIKKIESLNRVITTKLSS